MKPNVVAKFDTGEKFWIFQVVDGSYLRIEGPIVVDSIALHGDFTAERGTKTCRYRSAETNKTYDEEEMYSTAEAAFKAGKKALDASHP